MTRTMRLLVLVLALLVTPTAARADDGHVEGRLNAAGSTHAYDNGNRILYGNAAALGLGADGWGYAQDEGVNALYGFSTDVLFGQEFGSESLWAQVRAEVGVGVLIRVGELRMPVRLSWCINVGVSHGYVATAGLLRQDGWSGELGVGTMSLGGASGWRMQAAVRRKVSPKAVVGVQLLHEWSGGIVERPWESSRSSTAQFFYAYSR